MKVLVDNNYIKAICGKCHSELGVHIGDIRYNDIAHRCSEFEASCGACGATVAIPAARIPHSWLAQITGE